MASVLTESSTVGCGHQGSVSVQGDSKLTVSGSAVLIKTGIMGKSVSGCTTAPASDSSGPTAKPCTTVASVSAGEATKLTVGGQAVMLDTLAGDVDGMVGKTTPLSTLTATAGQSKLTTQ